MLWVWPNFSNKILLVLVFASLSNWLTKFQFVSAIDAGEAFKRDILVAVLVANTTSMDFEVRSPKRISNSNYSQTALNWYDRKE
jgi:hypothetical protein